MYQIIWAKEAEKDYIDTLNYWVKHNQSNIYSKKIIEDVEATENLISENPFFDTMCDFEETYKVKILNHFSLYYRISADVIQIVSFWDNRRNPDNLNLK